jgi:hypothetical protein
VSNAYASAAGSYYIGRLEDEEVENLLIYSLKEVHVEKQDIIHIIIYYV